MFVAVATWGVRYYVAVHVIDGLGDSRVVVWHGVIGFGFIFARLAARVDNENFRALKGNFIRVCFGRRISAAAWIRAGFR